MLTPRIVTICIFLPVCAGVYIAGWCSGLFEIDRQFYDKSPWRWRIKTRFDTVLAASGARLLRIG
jgi:hypothetical protein